jgi:hypothetical protein
MRLEMYLNEQLVDSITLIPSLFQHKNGEYIRSLIAGFEEKHAALLLQSGGKPVYYLSGIQSCINGFVPLRHPGQPHAHR